MSADQLVSEARSLKERDAKVWHEQIKHHLELEATAIAIIKEAAASGNVRCQEGLKHLIRLWKLKN